jgi:hypothetical protein
VITSNVQVKNVSVKCGKKSDALVLAVSDKGFVTGLAYERNCQQHYATIKEEQDSIDFPLMFQKDITKWLLEQLKLTSLSCTKLKTKYVTSYTFHILINEEDFPLINNTRV